MEFSLKHIIRYPKKEVLKPALLLMLHGYGSNEEDLFSFADELADDLLIVSARAPLSIAFGGYAWYSIHFEADNAKFSDIPEAIEARDLLVQFIDELQEAFHFDPKKSFLMGFSQGTILSYALSLSYPEKIHNIVALSGYINEELIQELGDVNDYEKLDFYCSHGSEDPVIPVDWARKIPNYLQKHSISHQYNEYYAGHGIAPKNFLDMKNWIESKLHKTRT
jgi:phospholipase/carboxylesterase